MSRQHALLSPSGAHRWTVCTPSARLTEGMNTTSSYADEGTLAHALAELLLKDLIFKLQPGDFAKELTKIQQDKQYTKAMFNYCYDYAVYIVALINNYVAMGFKPVLAIEEEQDYSYYVPQGKGYLDVAIHTERHVHVIDFKYGQGVPISAENNPQLKLYALGKLEKLTLTHDIKEINLTVYQPRIGNISNWFLTASELIHWAETVIKPAAALAWKGEGDFVPGEHCRFCARKSRCRALAEENLKITKHRFRDATLLEDDDISDILTKVDQISNWLSAIEAYALNEALQGKKWKGFKLVEGRANRVYRNEQAVKEKLFKLFYTEPEITESKLLPITKMEELLGGKLFNDYLKDLIIKPKGKITLVSNSDKREEINNLQTAKNIFDDGFDDSEENGFG